MQSFKEMTSLKVRKLIFLNEKQLAIFLSHTYDIVFCFGFEKTMKFNKLAMSGAQG